MKHVKRLTVLLLAVLLCLSLTGCRALEEMRAEQAFWQEDGSILWNGNVYRLLPVASAELNMTYDEDQPSVYVTASDVPVLLSAFFGEGMDVYQDGVLLKSWSEYEYQIYCRADSYEEIVARFEQGFTLDKMCYEYAVYDEDGWYDREETYTLTAEQMQTVIDVYSSVLPTAMEEGMYLSSDYSLSLYGYSEDGLFRNYLFEVQLAGTTYYLNDAENLYMVPAAYNAVFAAIMAPMVEEEQRFYGMLEEEYYDEEITL